MVLLRNRRGGSLSDDGAKGLVRKFLIVIILFSSNTSGLPTRSQ